MSGVVSFILVLLTISESCRAGVPSQRVAVIRNGGMYFSFTAGGDGTLVMATSKDSIKWSSWSPAVSSHLSVSSNPVAVTSYVASMKGYLVLVFVQTTDGQVTALVQNATDSTLFTARVLTSSLPVNQPASKQSHDPVQAVTNRNHTFLFVRTLTNTSQVYWIKFKDLLNFESRQWTQVSSGGGHLAFDQFGAVNTFLDRVELFAVFDSGYVMHTWQDSPDTFHKEWQKLGGPFSPKFNSAPVVHQMAHSDFNGVLNLYVRGTDNNLHHIAQTTCDKVNNVWGPCTWTVFYKLGNGAVPADPQLENPFVASHSFHGGIEVFTVGKAEGHLYHLWQRERDASYSSWEDLGPLSDPSTPFSTTPAIVMDDIGWWVAYALDSTQSLVKFLEKPIKFVLSSKDVTYGHNVTVSWVIPNDQATHMDWIGVYSHGAASHDYLDYSYVGGSQNPLKDPVPQGMLNFSLTLPNGQYDLRYMVNKAYVASLQSATSVSGQPSKENWVFFVEGLSRGLGGFNTNVTKCADDGDKTIETFKAAFTAFEDRKIFEGLHLIGDGLSDFVKALVQCNETILIKDLTKFIADLVACTEDACTKFLIDIGVELVILYEHIYEIYGDIQGASNNFKIESYEQGGFCVGRVTSACLKLE